MSANKRGKACRSIFKTERVATHEPVIKLCHSQLNFDVVLEHGMGISSTKLFHSLIVKQLLSYENDEKWAKCDICPTTTNHIIKPFLSKDDCVNDIMALQTIGSVFVFADGRSTSERLLVLTSACECGVKAIVEHDAESFSADEVEQRKMCCRVNGYRALQYVKQDPETMLYIKDDVDIALANEDFIDWIV